MSFNCFSYVAPHPPAPYDPYGGYPLPQVAMPTPSPMPAPSRYSPVQVICIILQPKTINLSDFFFRELKFFISLVMNYNKLYSCAIQP